jgi:hypothetical protein
LNAEQREVITQPIVLGEGALDTRAATPGFALKARVGLPALCIDASTV